MPPTSVHPMMLADLRDLHNPNRVGLWLAHSFPDERGNTIPLGYYEGRFEDVLEVVIAKHRPSFIDGPTCGDLEVIEPTRIDSPHRWRTETEQRIWEQAFTHAFVSSLYLPGAPTDIGALRRWCADLGSQAVGAHRALMSEDEARRVCSHGVGRKYLAECPECAP